jgi:hypothetical protein
MKSGDTAGNENSLLLLGDQCSHFIDLHLAFVIPDQRNHRPLVARIDRNRVIGGRDF